MFLDWSDNEWSPPVSTSLFVALSVTTSLIFIFYKSGIFSFLELDNLKILHNCIVKHKLMNLSYVRLSSYQLASPPHLCGVSTVYGFL